MENKMAEGIINNEKFWISRYKGVVYLVDKHFNVYPYDTEKLIQVGIWMDGDIHLFPGMEDALKNENLDKVLEEYNLIRKSKEG
jgi:hypothetical protein